MSKKIKKDPSKKVQIDIFTSHGGCGCTRVSFMDKIWRVLVDFREEVSYQIKDIDSEEADQYHQIGSFIVVNEKTVLRRNFSEASLRSAIKQSLQTQ